MKRFISAISVFLALAIICSFAALAAAPNASGNDYQNSPHFIQSTTEEINAKYNNGDKFILMCRRLTCLNCQYIGNNVVLNWMNTYGYDVYALDVDAQRMPTWVYGAVGNSFALPAVLFVENKNATGVTDNTAASRAAMNSAFYSFAGIVVVSNVSVSPATAALTVGATAQLTATVSPSNATNKNVTWTSSNASVATVSPTGLVTAKAVGTATITVTTAEGGKTARSTITVTAATIPVSSVTVSPATAALTVGATAQLTATVSPSNATNKNVTWTSSNASVATVSPTGLVTAKAAGTATITVTTADGGKTAQSTITVAAATIPVSSVTVSPVTAALTVGAAAQLTATVSPSNATNKNVTWTSSNASVATVSPTGLVTAKAAGTATITVKTADGNKTASCAITVGAIVISPTITIKNLNKITSINYGETLRLTAVTTDMPDGAKVVWRVHGAGVSLIASADGTTCDVTSTASGTVTVTAKIVDADDKPITDAEGNEISASQQIKSKAGFFQKLIAFFKKLFGSTKTIVQAIAN